MNITSYINSFANKPHRYRPYSKICKKLLLGSMPYSLNSQKGYEESEYLPYNIKSCVQAYASTKDTAIELFKDLVSYLKAEGVDVPQVNCSEGRVRLQLSKIIRSAYTVEELV